MRIDPSLRMADGVAALIRDAVRSMPGLPGPFMTSVCAEPLAVEIRDGDLWVRPATGDEVTELLTCLLADKAQSDPGVFRRRAMALVGAIAPVLVWLRDHKGVPLNINTMQDSTDLRSIWKLAMEKIALLRDPIDGTETQIDVSGGIPEDIIWPLRSYLGELPGYDPELPLDKQKSSRAVQAARLCAVRAPGSLHEAGGATPHAAARIRGYKIIPDGVLRSPVSWVWLDRARKSFGVASPCWLIHACGWRTASRL